VTYNPQCPIGAIGSGDVDSKELARPSAYLSLRDFREGHHWSFAYPMHFLFIPCSAPNEFYGFALWANSIDVDSLRRATFGTLGADEHVIASLQSSLRRQTLDNYPNSKWKTQ
jgi:hypothetical protein